MSEIEVKIYKPAKSAMQSGKAKKKWLMKPISKENHRKIFELMNWTSSGSTFQSQIEFDFDSKEDAVKFAEEKGFKYKIYEPKISSFKKKSYAENFTG